MPRVLRLLGSFAIVLLVMAWSTQAQAGLSQRERAVRITAELQSTGERYEGRHVTLWVAAGALDEQVARDFLVKLDRGVEVIRTELGKAVDERASPRRPEVYLSPRVGISHVRADIPTMVYMPTKRVLDGTAPYLHELVHAVASWSWRHSEWLGEGLANHVAQAVEARSGGYHHSVVLPDGLTGLDAHLASDEGRQMLALVGPRGRRSNYPPALAAVFRTMMANRPCYAPPFYALSWSFVDYLASRIGIEGLHAAATSPDGPDLEAMKPAWLASHATPR